MIWWRWPGSTALRNSMPYPDSQQGVDPDLGIIGR
ncbi:hypothetical protein SY94_5231 (plasmid) [Agrobacterium tumefaciens]|nr:hypothetical protein SY94_5231 [Agrobacterium tumefaciens]